jgi:CRISPR-associated protein Csd1
MILQSLYQYAEEEKLIESMEVKERFVHLLLNLRPDGTVSAAAPWTPLFRTVENPTTKEVKEEPGRRLDMPEFPGVNCGGKANFLADACDKVLGINGKTGEPLPDDPAVGRNATKAFLHFWQRIADAHAATGLHELAALLAFRDRYLANEDTRRQLPFVGMAPQGKDGKSTFCALADPPGPLAGVTITFAVGAATGPLFQKDSPLHEYWKAAFKRDRFADAPDEPGGEKPAGTGRMLGACLVTGLENQPIAEVHRTLIKGVPGLPPIGGYIVSFDKSSPAFTSFGFESGWNAPVSETAAAAYALALNHILADENCRRKFGGAVLASWIDGEHELTGRVNNFFLNPPPLKDEVSEFFRQFESGGKFHGALNTRHFRSITLASNGGRVVIRRWLDEPLGQAVDALKLWFDHLETVAIDVPGKGRKPREGQPSNAPPPLSIYALAATTARVPSEVADGVYDALYRAALEKGFNPRSLLAPLLQRLRIAAAQTGDGVRFKTSHFALLKLILIRSEESPMEITPQLCVTNDPAYNCGRLLAVLDDLQYAAQGRVGAGIVARYYGNASTFPRNVFPYLLRHSKHHAGKLKKDPSRQAAGFALDSKVNEICGLFPATTPGGPPDFPGLLGPQEQGRFALGFHQQKGKDERDRKLASEAKKRAADLDPELAKAVAIADALDSATSLSDSD